jgi:pyruvate kinase
MLLPNHKTKIVATIGPASESPEMLERKFQQLSGPKSS